MPALFDVNKKHLLCRSNMAEGKRVKRCALESDKCLSSFGISRGNLSKCLSLRNAPGRARTLFGLLDGGFKVCQGGEFLFEETGSDFLHYGFE